jgi:hypothetical protein
MAGQKMNYTTPIGTAQYPWLNKADFKFDDDGVFKTDVLVEADAAKDLVDKINQFAKDTLGDKISKGIMPYKTDPDTGQIIFKTKSKYQPKFKDSAAQMMVKDIPQVWGGSVIRVAGTLTSYDKGVNCGVKLNLNAVQIIKLSEGGGDGADFGAVDDGFVASKSSTDSQPNEFDADF